MVDWIESQQDMKNDNYWKIISEDLGMSEKRQNWMCQVFGSFWLRRTSPYWNKLLIYLFLHHVIFFFSKLKGIMKGTHFEAIQVIKRTITIKPRGMSEESFQQCIKTCQGSALDSRGIHLKRKSCSLGLKIEISCLKQVQLFCKQNMCVCVCNIYIYIYIYRRGGNAYRTKSNKNT